MAAWHRELVIARNALGVIDQDNDADQYAGALKLIGRLSEQIHVANLVIEAAVAELKGESE